MRTVAYVFPGQGSQSVGMGRALAAGSPAAAAVFAAADAALGEPISTLAWEGPEEQLNLTENAQPALLATSLAYLVTVYEVMGTATSIRVDTFRVYDTLIAAGIVYFALVFILTRVLNWLERRLNKDRMAVTSLVQKPATA